MPFSSQFWAKASLLSILHFAYTANSQILSCADVDCPVLDGTALSNCSVAGSSYPVIGLASSESSSGANLEWTIAVNQTKNDTDTTINRAFYLGVESSSVLRYGCSLFFELGSRGPFFYPAVDVPTDCIAPHGSVTGGFSAQCAADLKSQANALVATGNYPCDAIADDLLYNPPSTCSISSDSRIEAVLLSGDDAPKAISAAENQTSNCWPTLPKSNELIPVYVATVHTTTENNAIVFNAAGTTAIMTLFFGHDDDDELRNELVCVRPLDLNDKSVQTLSTNTGGASGTTSVSGCLAALVAICYAIHTLI